MLEGLLLEVMCKEELKRTITYDFMYISVVLGFFWATLYYSCIKSINAYLHSRTRSLLLPHAEVVTGRSGWSSMACLLYNLIYFARHFLARYFHEREENDKAK